MRCQCPEGAPFCQAREQAGVLHVLHARATRPAAGGGAQLLRNELADGQAVDGPRVGRYLHLRLLQGFEALHRMHIPDMS